MKNKVLVWLAALSVPFAGGLISGCGTTETAKKAEDIRRPKHMLGTSINSRADDFAAGLEPQQAKGSTSDSLLFTSNLKGREITYGVRIYPEVSSDSIQTQEVQLHDMPSQFVRHTGTVTRGNRSIVFATSAAVDTGVGASISRQRGIIGGTDIFERVYGGEPRNSTELNSPAWDAHPTIALNNDVGMEVIAFSSDRFDNDGGFSAPYENAEHVLADGQIRKGNADIYIAFRSKDSIRWTAPINFANLQTTDSVNTPFNEYSPYLYCIEGTPHLLFSSNRTGDYNIYDASLRIEWDKPIPDKPGVPLVVIERLQIMPMSEDSINTSHNEMFPFMRTPYMFFSSDRFARSDSSSAFIGGFGGLDIYATKAEVICITPPKEEKKKSKLADGPTKVDTIPSYNIIPAKIDTVYGKLSYDVTVINRETGQQGVENGTLRVFVDGDKSYEGANNTYTFEQDLREHPQGVRIRAEATSSLNRTPCNEKDYVLTHYSHVALQKRSVVTRARTVQLYRDSIIQDPVVRVKKTVRAYKMLAEDVTIYDKPLNPKIKEAIAIKDGRLQISFDTIISIDSVPSPRVQRFPYTVKRIDSIFTFDTSLVACSFSPGRSIASMFGELTIPQTFRTTYDNKPVAREDIDIVIHDTIYLVPQYDKAPVCDTLFGPPVTNEVRNIPYFQTAFWEVNTSNGYRMHMDRLREGDLKNASFIELNWRNKYWGTRSGDDVSDRMTRRREDYRQKARIIDASIKRMTTSTADMLAKFWERDADKPEAKLIVSIRAYSDIRPISVGRFISDTTVRYISTSFDDVKLAFTRPTAVGVPPGASLVGENNDTLSKLRAYFGFDAVYDQLANDSLLSALRAKGLVLLPTDAQTPQDYESRMKSARVIVLAEGQYVDTSVNPSIKAYKDGDDNYYDLDGVRRVDVHVRRVNLRGDQWVLPECCR